MSIFGLIGCPLVAKTFLLSSILNVLGLLFAGADLGAGLLVFSVKNSFMVSIIPPSAY
jgi:hypothetical protein